MSSENVRELRIRPWLTLQGTTHFRGLRSNYFYSSYSRCRTDTDEKMKQYKFMWQAQEMLNHTSTKVDNIIRK